MVEDVDGEVALEQKQVSENLKTHWISVLHQVMMVNDHSEVFRVEIVRGSPDTGVQLLEDEFVSVGDLGHEVVHQSDPVHRVHQTQRHVGVHHQILYLGEIS